MAKQLSKQNQFMDLLGSDVLHVEIFSKVCVDIRDRRNVGLELSDIAVHVLN